MTKVKPSRQGLLTTEQAARLLGLRRRTLEGWRVRGGGPTFVQISKRCIRYRIEDLESWTESRLRRSTSDSGIPRGVRPEVRWDGVSPGNKTRRSRSGRPAGAARKIAEQLLKPVQAARVLGLDLQTLARWRAQGTGPRFVRIGQRTVRYRWSELVEWARSEAERERG